MTVALLDDNTAEVESAEERLSPSNILAVSPENLGRPKEYRTSPLGKCIEDGLAWRLFIVSRDDLVPLRRLNRDSLTGEVTVC